MKYIPTPTIPTTPPTRWQGITDLRESLVYQGRVMEALRLSTAERALSTAAGRYQIIQALLQLGLKHQKQVLGTENEVYWRAAMLRVQLDLATLFTSWKMKTEAKQSLLILEKNLEEVVSLVNGGSSALKASDALDTLSIEFCRLKLLEEEERTESHFQQLLRLGEKMLAGTNVETDQCHYLAIAWAKKLYPERQFAAVRTNIQLRTQYLFENVQGRVVDAAVNLGDILTPRVQNINKVTQNIEMLDLFEKKYGEIYNFGAKEMLSGLRSLLYAQRGDRVPLKHLRFDIGTPYRVRQNVSSDTLNGEDVKLKDVIDKEDNAELDLDQLYGFFSESVETRVPRHLKGIVEQEMGSGILTEDALSHIFALGGETTRKMSHDDFLKLNGKEMLQMLVGTHDSPVSREEWLERVPALREWLLNDDRGELPVRRCLWIGIHDARYIAWQAHCVSSIWIPSPDMTGNTQPNRTATPNNFVPGTETPATSYFNATHQLIGAIEDRVELDEARLGYMFGHYETDTHVVASLLPVLYTQLFFSSYSSGEKPSVTMLSYLDRADNLAREQLTYWKSVNNYINIAKQSINIGTIAQYKLECGLIRELALVKQTFEEALGLLDEVEMFFGTTLCDLDLENSLASLEIKMHTGSKMDIWGASNIAKRLLLSAIQFIKDNTEKSDHDESTTDCQVFTMNLWQCVQRGKARALAQSMGLDKMVPDSVLLGIRDSISKGQIVQDNGVATDGDEAVGLQTIASIPVEFLSEARELLKDSNIALPKLRNKHLVQKTSLSETRATPGTTIEDIISFSQNLRNVNEIEAEIQNLDEVQADIRRKLEVDLSRLNDKIDSRPELYAILKIADLLNKEDELQDVIKSKTLPNFQDRFQSRIDLQSLRQEMTSMPLLQQMLRVREGWPLSENDLHEIAGRRNGKVVFVDWFSTMSLFNTDEKIYMIVWRDGKSELIDLRTTLHDVAKSVHSFFANPDVFLPEVDITLEKDMDMEDMVPKNRSSDPDEERKIWNCANLIKPLLDRRLVEPEDLLVFSTTEGFNNFPLHAITHNTHEPPLIIKHPVVYVPSLSVLHRCYWSRHGKTQVPHVRKAHKALVLGGVVSKGYTYGKRGVERIGAQVNVPCKTFLGAQATASNLRANIPGMDLLHFHLHTNYKLSEERKEPDVVFTESPLTQALCFTDTNLTTPQILSLRLEPGAHLNLVACASGQQGKFQHGNAALWAARTNEVMGLVPAFLIAGSGSMTSTLWPIRDEHAAVFGGLFWKGIGAALESHDEGNGEEEMGQSWVDIANVYRGVVLAMRTIYGSPLAWAGFVLNGYWQFEV